MAAAAATATKTAPAVWRQHGSIQTNGRIRSSRSNDYGNYDDDDDGDDDDDDNDGGGGDRWGEVRDGEGAGRFSGPWPPRKSPSRGTSSASSRCSGPASRASPRSSQCCPRWSRRIWRLGAGDLHGGDEAAQQPEFDKDAVVRRIVELVGPRHTVSLANPRRVVVVEVIQALCGLSVVDGHEHGEFVEFNLRKFQDRIRKSKEAGGGMGGGAAVAVAVAAVEEKGK